MRRRGHVTGQRYSGRVGGRLLEAVTGKKINVVPDKPNIFAKVHKTDSFSQRKQFSVPETEEWLLLLLSSSSVPPRMGAAAVPC